jgi:quercetin dioxygenase-like cupin family protein
MNESELAAPIIHPPGSGRRVGVLGSHSTFKVESGQTGGAYAVLEQRVPPGEGPPLHVHRHETEIFYILEGEFEIRVGGAVVRATAGATAACPRDIPHTFRNVGESEGRLLLTVIPGQFANYFIEVDAIRDQGYEATRALAAKFGVEFVE